MIEPDDFFALIESDMISINLAKPKIGSKMRKFVIDGIEYLVREENVSSFESNVQSFKTVDYLADKITNLSTGEVIKNQNGDQKVVPGYYEHYKGGKYLVLEVVDNAEPWSYVDDKVKGPIDAQFVLSFNLDHKKLWVRPVSEFLKPAEVNGDRVSRFKLVEAFEDSESGNVVTDFLSAFIVNNNVSDEE